MEIQFGEYLPDLPPYNNPGLTVARNVVAVSNNYQAFPTSSVYSNALAAACKGAVSYRDSAGNTVNFAGNATKLYKSASAVFADKSKVSGYTTSPEEKWRFAKYGDIVIATNFSDPIQSFNLSSSSLFANLSATPNAPQARYLAVMRDFLVVGNTYDAVNGNVPHRVRWTAVGDVTDFAVSAQTQSDYNDLNSSYGYVQAVVGGEYGVIYQERCITRMSYSGSPAIWRFDEVEPGKGTQAPGSVIKVGTYIFYLGIDGFYVFDGTQSVNIGSSKVDKTFFAEIDLNYLSNIVAAADFDKQVIYWAYPIWGNTSGRPNKILAYNYAPNSTKRWSTIEGLDLEHFYVSLGEGYTLDSLDTISSSIDAITISLDSRVWTGKNFILSGFDSSHRQINFNGSPMTSVIETQEVSLSEGMLTDVNLVRPLIEGGTTVAVQIGTRNRLTDSVTWSSSSTPDSIGNCPFRVNGVYHRARVTLTGGFTSAQGIGIVQAAASAGR